jgi:eukaryotic-like serine/threonine-protein kinase
MKPFSPEPAPVPPAAHPGPAPARDAAERLRDLWQQGGHPDVGAFLAEAGPLPPAKLAAVLRVDQRERWQAGERVRAEDYLRRYPDVSAEPEAAIDLIFNEFLLRERLGDRPSPEEYLRRFPEYAAVLRPQIDLHRAMQGNSLDPPKPPRPAEPTTVDAGGGAPPGGPPGRFRVALVAGSGPQPAREIQALLRKRWRGCGLIGTGAFVFFVIVQTSALFQDPGLSLLYWLITAEFWFMLVTLAAFTSILWTRRPLSLAQLRGIEAVLVGACLAHMALLVWLDLQFGSSLVRALADNPAHWGRPVTYWAFPFFVLIVGYGTLIPNTGRRCLLVVGTMALTPLTILAVTGLSVGATLTSNLGFLLSYLAMYMAVAVAMATYGSHRIEVLRQEAFEARKLGQYRLRRRLGSGGMGEVYLAEHALLRRPCALKLIRPERAGDPQHLRRFEREVQATATLTHPSTVEIFDYGHAADGTFYYVMEYLPGLNLDELVKQHGPLPPARAVHLLRQVCGALREAHAIGLVHRDIKPNNILACERGGRQDVAKLLDFGLVQTHNLAGGGEEATRLTQTGAIAGTPAYMSPEQAAGQADLDARSDIYSLGAVAYFLLTGRPPFVRETPLLTLVAHLTDPVPPPRDLRPDLPADLQAVVLHCLEKDPARRFPDAAALERALAQCACADGWSWEAAGDWWRARATGAAAAPGGTPS